ncbi:MAG: hypothetical protein RLZZ453_783 [Chlamydiota bacterium]|jgi:hypothetical protein
MKNSVYLDVVDTSYKTVPWLDVLPLGEPGDVDFPITIFLDPYEKNKTSFSADQLLFCYNVVLSAIRSVQSGVYSDFDGHTTANCCHGISLLAWHLIQSVLSLDLDLLKKDCEKTVEILVLKKKNELLSRDFMIKIPSSLIHLSCLYILCFVREYDSNNKGRTNVDKLHKLGSLSNKQNRALVKSLQKCFSNWVAEQYSKYKESIHSEAVISGMPVSLWGKYVAKDWIRTDKRGIKHASTLFSVQIFLAYLSCYKGKVAILHDVYNPSKEPTRYFHLFEGNGSGSFDRLKPMHHDFLADEPVIVLGGCAHTKDFHVESVMLSMEPWLEKLPELVLACDTVYPQFVCIGDDAEFDSSPIVPAEKQLQELITKYRLINGVSLEDPSLYCLTHIHVASLREVLDPSLLLRSFNLPGMG